MFQARRQRAVLQAILLMPCASSLDETCDTLLWSRGQSAANSMQIVTDSMVNLVKRVPETVSIRKELLIAMRHSFRPEIRSCAPVSVRRTRDALFFVAQPFTCPHGSVLLQGNGNKQFLCPSRFITRATRWNEHHRMTCACCY